MYFTNSSFSFTFLYLSQMDVRKSDAHHHLLIANFFQLGHKHNSWKIKITILWTKNTYFQRWSHNPWGKNGNFNPNSNFSQGHCNLCTFTPTAHPVFAKLNLKLHLNCYLHLNLLRNFQIKFVEKWIYNSPAMIAKAVLQK